MRILVVSNLYPPDVIGGYELSCRQAVDALRRRGHHVEVLTSIPRNLVPTAPGIRRHLRLADVYSASSIATPRPVRLLTESEASYVATDNIYAVATALADTHPDVIYMWNLIGIGGLGILGFLEHQGLPWVWHLGDWVPARLAQLDGALIPSVAQQLGQRLSGTCICCSDGLRDEIARQGVELGCRVEVLPNWIEGERPARRARHYRPGEHLRAAFSGQVITLKGADIVIDAAIRLRKQGFVSFSIDLFGQVHEPRYQYMIDRAGLSDAVRLRGWRDQAELIRELDEHDIFLFPTHRREPFGLAPLEAMSRSCVAVVSDDCGIAEWFVGGVHLLKAPRLAEDFAQIMRDVLEGNIDLAPIARIGADVVWRDFHVDSVMARVEPLLIEAAAQRRAPAGSVADAYELAGIAQRLVSSSLLSARSESP
jgi:glycogen synthase